MQVVRQRQTQEASSFTTLIFAVWIVLLATSFIVPPVSLVIALAMLRLNLLPSHRRCAVIVLLVSALNCLIYVALITGPSLGIGLLLFLTPLVGLIAVTRELRRTQTRARGSLALDQSGSGKFQL